MFMPVTPAAAIPTPTRAQLRLAVLAQWIDAGMTLLREAMVDAGRGFSDGSAAMWRVIRAVRLAILLAARLGDPRSAALRPAPTTARAPATAEPRPASPPTVATPAERPRHCARLARFAGDPPADSTVLRRPLVEIVKEICGALGLTPDWSLWSDEAPETAAPPARPAPTLASRPPMHPVLERLFPDRPAWRPPSGPPPLIGRLLSRLRSSCAPLALDPPVFPAGGGFRLGLRCR